MNRSFLMSILFTTLLPVMPVGARETTVSSLAEFAAAAAEDGGDVIMTPGVYRLADYLTEDVLAEIREGVDRAQKRPPVPMFTFRGNNNRFDLKGVTIEIDTSLYAKVPQGGYTRCFVVSGNGNAINGLTIRGTGPNQGSGGNYFSIAGEGNSFENLTLHVHGSSPWGYGDLLGKGGPNLVALQKQSGIQVLGSRTRLRRCKVFSRAFGHCFYIQQGEGTILEDCYAEGVMRPTTDMLADNPGLGIKSVYENRDGRYVITPGYMKSLVEDGFRTYGGAGNVTLVNCTAVNTRSGFEIGAKDDSPVKSVIENCLATGCERGYLLGSNVIVKKSRGDVRHGPLLYLRGGINSDIELELAGERPETLVHVIATLAGTGHRVRLSSQPNDNGFPRLPVMLGFGMPDHAEMASPIRPSPAVDLTLDCELPGVPVVTSSEAKNCRVQATGGTFPDEELRKSPGKW